MSEIKKDYINPKTKRTMSVSYHTTGTNRDIKTTNIFFPGKTTKGNRYQTIYDKHDTKTVEKLAKKKGMVPATFTPYGGKPKRGE